MSLLGYIGNHKIRNFVRGVLASPNDYDFVTGIERIKANASMSDAGYAFEILYDEQPNKKYFRLPAFPKTLDEVYAVHVHKSKRLGNELACVTANFGRYKDEIVDAVQVYGNLCDAIKCKNIDGIISSLDTYSKTYGISLAVLGKLVFLQHSTLRNEELQFAVSNYLKLFTNPVRLIHLVLAEKILDSDHSYLSTRREFLNYVDAGSLDVGANAIIQNMCSPLRPFSGGVAQKIHAYSRWGAFDTYLFLRESAFIAKRYNNESTYNVLQAAIPSSIENAFAKHIPEISLEELSSCLQTEREFLDRGIFECSAFWSEVPSILSHRLDVEDVLGARFDGSFPSRSRNYPRSFHIVDSVCDVMPTKRIDPESAFFTLDSCGVFNRTISLIASIEQNPLACKDGAQARNLLDCTVDLPKFLSKDERDSLFPKYPNDLLNDYLKSAVEYDSLGNERNYHRFRTALQKIVISNHDRRIVAFLEDIDSDVGHVANHLAGNCSHYFLSELYRLLQSPEEVIEAEADILEWYGSTRNDKLAEEQAKSNRLSLVLAKIRGGIEDTRVYVEPVRFIDWVKSNFSSDFRSLSEMLTIDPKLEGVSEEFSDPIKALQLPILRLAKILDECYHEFCMNKYNGIDSLISRRIRHGSLHGRLVKQFAPLFESAIEKAAKVSVDLETFLVNWLTSYDKEVSKLASDYFHIRSKPDKPCGLIVPSISDVEKASVVENAISTLCASIRDKEPLSDTSYIFHERCWQLFEVDLKRMRNALDELRRRYVIDPSPLLVHCGPDAKSEVQQIIRKVNTSLQVEFDAVKNWLSRPESIVPTASIIALFEVVLEEVQKHHPEFKPKTISSGSGDVSLFGNRFHFFYDALYVLVGNAAMYGLPDGELGIHIEAEVADNSLEVSVTVTSQVLPEELADCAEKIRSALNADIGDAMNRESGKGIKKIRGLVASVEEIVSLDFRTSQDRIIFSINMIYPIQA